ncbi:glycosyltransferase [Paraburkholderia sp. UCT31]|uniref:glycosyltransferase family 2 protein n=1 Tax=Paraburkholderia sp. UCT31 TaxID=2615209 RepID=UPI00165662C4|nr:glycosyltransferase family 2 protein [Paraburkholderia sp. UCT31]MBC8739794.1 glycosyltransferase [Paraburkholderia sp. UCT31]
MPIILRALRTRSFYAQFFLSLVIVAVAAATTGALWACLENPATPAAWDGHFSGVTYSGYRAGESPLTHVYPTADEVREDMKLLAGVTNRIRTYTSTEGPDVVALAEERSLKVMAGAHITGANFESDAELAALWDSAEKHKNVDRLIVGNETLLTNTISEPDLIHYLDVTRQHTSKPVSTAEPWHVWLKYPELANHVDFIAVHLLPYWEKLPAPDAVNYAFDRLAQLQARFPHKPIVVTETGWPSHGDRRDAAVASRQNEALYLREFAVRAKARHIDYYVIEAFDQPWKLSEEGRSGGYWGIWSATRELKVPASTTVYQHNAWPRWAMHTFAFALLPAFTFCLLSYRMRLLARYGFTFAIFTASGFMNWYSHSFSDYYTAYDMRPVQAFLEVIAGLCTAALLVQLYEATEALGLRKWRRRFGIRRLRKGQEEPLVSIHLACANEPPEMVILTLESLARLNWTNYEVVVVDNNTQEEAKWRPLETWVNEHPEHFKFFHMPSCPGFKAGALNFALQHTHADAAVVAVVDADYEVDANWLHDLSGHFNEPAVTLVQSPQAHRDFENDWLQRAAAYEFDGFFRIGMHHRNDRNGIIMHGTMTMVRAKALRDLGGWAEWTICEDAELGLRLMKAGGETRYVDIVYGKGLAPTTFAALKSQRRRWALGAMQILKGHFADLVRPGLLTPGQQYHFLMGWLPWISEALQALCTVACLFWTAGMLFAPKFIEPPVPAALCMLFLVPILRGIMGIALYRAKVKCSWKDTFAAALISMGLNHSVAMGIFAGLFRRRARFVVTKKGKPARTSCFGAVREEALSAGTLLFGALATVLAYSHHALEPMNWAAALTILSAPYVASLVVAWCASRAPKALRAGAVDKNVSPKFHGPAEPACASPTLPGITRS